MLRTLVVEFLLWDLLNNYIRTSFSIIVLLFTCSTWFNKVLILFFVRHTVVYFRFVPRKVSFFWLIDFIFPCKSLFFLLTAYIKQTGMCTII